MFVIALTIIVGIVGGVAVGVQSPIAGSMSQYIGGTASSLVVHFGGFILSGMLLIVGPRAL